MTSIDNLLKLSTELSKLGSELTEVGGKLAQAAATLQQEAANIAEEMSRQWGVDVSVNVGVRPSGVIRRDVVVANGGGVS
jgi:F420-0:gamma-glutamyl ligase-like protein